MGRFLINLISGISFLVFCYCVYLYENGGLDKTVFGLILFVIIGVVGLMSVLANKTIANNTKTHLQGNQTALKISIFTACIVVSGLLYKVSGMWHYLIIVLFSIFAIIFVIAKHQKSK